MSDWATKQIKDLGRVVTGKTPPTSEEKYFGGDKLFISPKDLSRDQYYVYETRTSITEEALTKFKNQVIPKNSIMFTSLSFGFGKMGITSEDSLTNQQINSVIVNDQNDHKFVFYLLKAYEPIIFSYNSGIDTPIVPKSVFESVKVKCPEKPLQSKIAAILSVYNDLIENNKRRITVLEKMAEEIYREWFVRMRFPEYEKAKFEKGVPNDWEIKKFGEFCMLQRGFDLPDAMVIEGEYPVVASTSIKTYHHQYKVEPPVITTGRSGSLGTVLFTNKKSWPLNTSLFVKKYYGNSPYLIYFTLKYMKLENFNAGAGVPSLNRNHLNALPIAVPPNEIQNQFDKLISTIFQQTENLQEAVEKLESTRNSLLPRLISGKLTVEGLDIQFPPSMQQESESDTEPEREATCA